MDDKKIWIFGYGSLINEDSFRNTDDLILDKIPVKLKSFVRVFNYPSPTRFSEIDGEPCAVLNIDKSEHSEFVNGVAYQIFQKDLDNFSDREGGYELVMADLETYDGRHFRGCFFRAAHFEAHNFIFDSSMQNEYLEICLEGCEEFGDEFLEDFKRTTFIGKKTLLDLGY